MWQVPQLSPIDIERLLKKVRDVLRVKHYSIRTEESYLRWIQYFFDFITIKNPLRMGKAEIGNFLTHLWQCNEK